MCICKFVHSRMLQHMCKCQKASFRSLFSPPLIGSRNQIQDDRLKQYAFILPESFRKSENTGLLLLLDKCRTIVFCCGISRKLISPKILHDETSYCMWWSCLTTSSSLYPCPYLDTCEECTVSMCAYVPGKITKLH